MKADVNLKNLKFVLLTAPMESTTFYDDITGQYNVHPDNLGNGFHGAALSGTNVSAEGIFSREFLGASWTNKVLFARVSESMTGQVLRPSKTHLTS